MNIVKVPTGMQRIAAKLARAATRRRAQNSTPGPQVESRRNETGASLILALLFLVVIGTVVGGIATWTSNDLSNTIVFQNASKVHTALTAATNTATQNIRYTPLIGSGSNPQTLNANPPSYCFGSTSPSQVTTQGYTVDVWCSTTWTPTSAATRVVTISACLSTIDLGNAATCAQSPGLQTVVTFDDYSALNPFISQAACTSPPTGTCGSGMTISSSLLAVGSPTVTLLSSRSGFVIGGGTLTVTGTGFVAGSTSVNFVGSAAAQNLVLNGTNVTVTSPTSLTVSIPPATTTGAYNVLVTTPNGTSGAIAGVTVYTYNPDAPTVTGVTTSSGSATGSAAGGSTIIVTGSGFLSQSAGDSTTVQFIDQGPGTNVYTAPSSSVVVNSTGTQLTATTPAISSTDLNYSVQVVTAPGGSSGTAFSFTYSPLLPLAASVFATQGPAGTQVTVTGVGFITNTVSAPNNTVVQLVPTTGNGATLTLTGVSVSGSTTLTGTVPTGGTNNRAYYVEVTTPSGSSGSSGAPQYTWT